MVKRKSKDSAGGAAKKIKLPSGRETKKDQDDNYHSKESAYTQSFRKTLQEWYKINCPDKISAIKNKKKWQKRDDDKDRRANPTLTQYLGWLDSLKNRDEEQAHNTNIKKYWNMFCAQPENKKMVASWKEFAQDIRTPTYHQFQPNIEGLEDYIKGGGKLHPQISFPSSKEFVEGEKKVLVEKKVAEPKASKSLSKRARAKSTKQDSKKRLPWGAQYEKDGIFYDSDDDPMHPDRLRWSDSSDDDSDDSDDAGDIRKGWKGGYVGEIDESMENDIPLGAQTDGAFDHDDSGDMSIAKLIQQDEESMTLALEESMTLALEESMTLAPLNEGSFDDFANGEDLAAGKLSCS